MPLLPKSDDKNFIQYGKINVTFAGKKLTRLLSLKIWQNAGDHGYAEVAGEINPEDGKQCVERFDEKSALIISCSEPSIKLFEGGIINVEAEYRHEYCRLYIKAATVSYQMDLDKKSESFQNTKKKYMDILKSSLQKSKVSVEGKITDKTIDKPVVRYKETDWNFARRIAAEFNTMVFTPINATTKKITIGLPDAAKSIEIKGSEYSAVMYSEDYQKFVNNTKDTGSIIAQDFSDITVASLQYLQVADKVKFNDKEYYIKNVRAKLYNTLYMEMEYDLAGKNAFIGRSPDFSLAGAMFMGQVKEVKEEKVKVHIMDIDEKYDSATDWLFTYSTSYSSAKESGWYVMPEVNDYVRVVFPANDTSKSFASSTVNTVVGDKASDKRFKAPKGKELLFTEKGIYITCAQDKVFVNLTDDNGVEISSSKDVNVTSKKNINIAADSQVNITANSKVNIGCSSSALNVGVADILVSSGTIALT